MLKYLFMVRASPFSLFFLIFILFFLTTCMGSIWMHVMCIGYARGFCTDLTDRKGTEVGFVASSSFYYLLF
jgi:hypothetical protein